jgi:UPF0755 protein
LCAALALLGGWTALELQPVGADRRRVVFVVRRGDRVATVASRLADAGLVRSATAFFLYASLGGHGSRLRAGRYRLSPSMSVREVVAALRRGGSPESGVVTIPEGFTVRQIAETLYRHGVLADPEAFVRLARRPVGIRTSFRMPPTGLEGYLFPETYAMGERTPAAAALQRMVDAFEARFARPYADEIARSGHTLHELVTIASLVEREAEVESDRARIAGVIENRLRRGMRLQIDATVLYALGRHKSRVLYRDLQVASPYNTYRRAGLPPGPIASPGLASLLAALRPARHHDLYYVAGPGGAHIFTATEAEHNRAVARVRALRRPPKEVRGDALR